MRKINVRAVRAFREAILLRHHVCRFLSKQLRLQQVAHPQPASRHFVFVGRADPAGSRANLVRPARAFRGFVQLPVIRENQMSAVADVQASLHVDPGFGKGRNFCHQRRRIHNRACSDHGMLFRAKYSAGDKLKHVAVFPDDDRVPRVVAARNTRDVIKRSCKVVNHLALAFIAPLRSDHDHRFHAILLLDHTSAAQRSLRLYCFGKDQETAGSYRKLASPSTQASAVQTHSDLGRVRSFSYRQPNDQANQRRKTAIKQHCGHWGEPKSSCQGREVEIQDQVRRDARLVCEDPRQCSASPTGTRSREEGAGATSRDP